MARADNSSFLTQANARRRQAALSAAHHAIEQLQRQGRAVSFSTVAQSAGVSRGWLYRQDQIRDLINRPWMGSLSGESSGLAVAVFIRRCPAASAGTALVSCRH